MRGKKSSLHKLNSGDAYQWDMAPRSRGIVQVDETCASVQGSPTTNRGSYGRVQSVLKELKWAQKKDLEM